MSQFFLHLRHREDGQGLVEYAFILMLVAIAVIAVLALFGDSLAQYYTDAYNELDAVW